MKSGRPFSDGDIRSGSSVCVIGQTIKTDLFGQADPLGQRLRLGNVSCEVIGVVEGKGQSAFGTDQDSVVFMPLRTFQRRIAGNQRISTIYISVASADAVDACKSRRKTSCANSAASAPDEEDDFSVRDMTQIVSTLSSTTTLMTGLLSAVAACQPARRRHRHHEHHAGLGDRAHPRDRHPPGHRRPGTSRC